MPSSPSLQAWAKHDVARFVDVLVKHQPVALWRAHAPCAIIMEHSGGALLSDRCGLFATLGECFCPTTLLGDFPVRMSQYEYVGGVRMGVECESGVRCRLCAGPLGHQAKPFDAAKSKNEQSVTSPARRTRHVGLVGHDASLARVRRGKSPAAGFLSPGGRGVVVLLAMTRPANLRYGKSRPVDSTAAGRGAYAIRALRGYEPAAGLL
jgi:hypothetical protein